ncbi:hypothetical protein [Propionivibrio soli]|uniref:hypothetical protein n=1 Tax=Propionivibrio soli TaxID=2976531 RepID=UPI0021E6DECE|nr:hypothetical protein [Propionivibrio soli]
MPAQLIQLIVFVFVIVFFYQRIAAPGMQRARESHADAPVENSSRLPLSVRRATRRNTSATIAGFAKSMALALSSPEPSTALPFS